MLHKEHARSEELRKRNAELTHRLAVCNAGVDAQTKVMPADLHHYLENSMERMTRTASELEGCNLVQTHWDPRLRAHRPAYLRLVKHLMRLGRLVTAVAAGSAH